MEKIEERLAKELSNWGMLDSAYDIKQVEEYLKSFFKTDKDARWALQKTRDKQAYWLDNHLYYKGETRHPKVSTIIYEAFDLSEKEEESGKPIKPIPKQVELPEELTQSDIISFSTLDSRRLANLYNKLLKYLEQKGV